MNNYNECEDMENIELHVYQDGDLARHCFEEQFNVIQYSGYREYFVAEYLPGCGERQIYSVSDCYDLTVPTRREFRQFAIDYMRTENMTFRDLVQDMFDCFGNWKEYAECILNDKSWNETAREGLPFLANGCELFALEHVSGHSQGDYGYVFVPCDCQMKRNDLENLIYSAPVSIRLEVDGNDHYIELPNPYEYGKDCVFALICEQVKGLSVNAMEWIEENLPDCPEYVG
jgi:hypothetical protein